MAMKTFRIKEHSDVDNLIDWLQAENEAKRPLLKRNAIRKGGFVRETVHTVWALAEQSDNYTLGHYTETQERLLLPGLSIGDSERPTAQAQGSSAPDLSSQPVIYMPAAPIMTEEVKNFVEPDWYARMSRMVDLGRNIALAGPPGIGKSTAVEQLAAERHIPLVNISADNGLRRRDLTGNTEIVQGHTRFAAAMYVAAALNGWWVKVDEVNAAEPDALMFINSQIAPPYEVNFYGRSEKVHPNFRLFVTFNPGLTGTKTLPESFKDRFFPIKLGFPNEAGLRKLLLANGGKSLNSGQLDALIRFGLLAWQQHTMGRCRYQITPRRLFDAMVLIHEGESTRNAIKESVLAIIDNPNELAAIEEALRKSEV